MLRTLTNTDPNKLSAAIINHPESVYKHRFGLFGSLSPLLGPVYFIKPTPENTSALTTLYKMLDEQPGTRPAFVSFFVSDNPGAFPSINERTDANAKFHHKAFLQSLNRPTDYIRFTLDHLKRFLHDKSACSLRELTTTPVRAAMATGMFNTDGIPDTLDTALSKFTELANDIMDNFAETAFNVQLATCYPSLIKANSKLVAARNQYLSNIQSFIDSQAMLILEDLHRYAKNDTITHVLSLIVIQLIKENHPEFANDEEQYRQLVSSFTLNELTPYLSHPDVKSVPGNIMASENSVIILNCGLLALAQNAALLDAIRSLNTDNALGDFSDAQRIQAFIQHDARHNGLLHALYIEALRRESLLKPSSHLQFESITTRVTKKAIRFDNTDIPANSMLMILSALPRFDSHYWENPGEFNPNRFLNPSTPDRNLEAEGRVKRIFSYGSRMCPANHMSEYMIKAFLLYVACHYQLAFDFEADSVKNPERRLDQVMDPSKVRMTLTPLVREERPAFNM